MLVCLDLVVSLTVQVESQVGDPRSRRYVRSCVAFVICLVRRRVSQVMCQLVVEVLECVPVESKSSMLLVLSVIYHVLVASTVVLEVQRQADMME